MDIRSSARGRLSRKCRSETIDARFISVTRSCAAYSKHAAWRICLCYSFDITR